MLNYYLLGVLELRFRGGELCRGRGDGEHDSILNRVCVYEEISRPFFSRSFQSGFFRGKDSLRVSKIQKNSYILNPPKMASIRSISSVWLERAPNISRRQINSVLLSAQGHRFEPGIEQHTAFFAPRNNALEVLTCRVNTCYMFFFCM